MEGEKGRIVIEPEDLPPDEDEGRIVIRPEDLAEEGASSSPSLPARPLPSPHPPFGAPFGAVFSGLFRSNLAMGALFGLLGGFIGWLLIEPFVTDLGAEVPALRAVAEAALIFGVVGGVLGASLGAVEGVTAGAPITALYGSGLGLALGALGGLLGGAAGQIAYSLMGGGMGESLAKQMVARAVGWAVVACIAGMAQGARLPSWVRIRNGALGGFGGGLIGGLLFDPIGLMGGGGELSRAVAIALIGLATGLSVALVEELLKEAWLTVVEGPLAGKKFIIYRNPTIIGSSPKCDIPLVKDPQVLPRHAAIGREGRAFVVWPLGGAVLVNRSPVGRGRPLRRGDLLQVGSTTLRFDGIPLGP